MNFLIVYSLSTGKKNRENTKKEANSTFQEDMLAKPRTWPS